MKLLAAEQELCLFLQALPRKCQYRYNSNAGHTLVRSLFWSLVGGNEQYLRYLFPTSPSDDSQPWRLKAAQGAVEGAEYTAAAKGHQCGHIFKSGEATYQCKTCSVDDTCVLCSKCFEASDHENHAVFVSLSMGNSGCCDCGDMEAWVKDVHCTIHTADPEDFRDLTGRMTEAQDIPSDLVESIRMTVARTLDYICDVFSCSPEQLRVSKTEQSVRMDEKQSRLASRWYGTDSEDEKNGEYALILWNDEKHTVDDVRDQVARACKIKKSVALEMAHQVNDFGRCIVKFSSDVDELLRMAQSIEQIKVTVTVRSARDTFREQMCETIIGWLSDIAGCSVGNNHELLRKIVCEELLSEWRMGSQASNVAIGRDGIDDHQIEEMTASYPFTGRLSTGGTIIIQRGIDRLIDDDSDGNDENDNNDEDYVEFGDGGDIDLDNMDLEIDARANADEALNMTPTDLNNLTSASETTFAGFTPPPSSQHSISSALPFGDSVSESQDSRAMSSHRSVNGSLLDIPKTPKVKVKSTRFPKVARHWLEKPAGHSRRTSVELCEDLWRRVRLDFLILYDLRMWKKLRGELRDLYISTVVTIPEFKRLLGLRFASLYIPLAQLYLVADREPDHSITMLSVQMLTTRSITAEVVERANFLTNLLALLYTFLTTRQVGYPSEVNSDHSLAFETGAVTNRRMYHFLQDLKYLLVSDWVKEKLCTEERYLLQFLDLVRLHQGICPNVRAVGEHIEYETDAWIHASLITREINKLCRLFSEAFNDPRLSDSPELYRAIRNTALITTRNSVGCDRDRFVHSEIKDEVQFTELEVFDFDKVKDKSTHASQRYTVVNYVVEKGPLSFHHALHYMLSWLIERGKEMSATKLRDLLQFSYIELTEAPYPQSASIQPYPSERYLLALFDYPLRVCAWLTQMRVGMWVRNGITLRHQMTTYKGYAQRDMSYQRDIFLLQVALVTCDPATFLASMVHRYSLYNWARGDYHTRPGFEDHHILDVAEDFIHLLIILLSERTALLTLKDEPNPHVLQCQKEIIHVLCFKPMSYSELTSRISDRVLDLEEFSTVLSNIATFRPPEGLADSGTFELKEVYIGEINPYITSFSRNQREDAENIYRENMAKKAGKLPSDIVFIPKLRPINTGVFVNLSAVSQTPLFAQVIYYFLGYLFTCKQCESAIPLTRVEIYAQFVLQLAILAILEDKTPRDATNVLQPASFVYFALCRKAEKSIHGCNTILALINALLTDSTLQDTFRPSLPKARMILQLLQSKQQELYNNAMQELGGEGSSHDDKPTDVSNEKELKKKQARERQARIMEEFKQIQNMFEEKNNIDWGEDVDIDDQSNASSKEENVWKFPSGTCILCQEETDDRKIYGTFGYVAESNILRQTPFDREEWVKEMLELPESLDRSAEEVRPFGVARQNRYQVHKVSSSGEVVSVARQDLGKGFPVKQSKPGPVAVGCGHITHYSCLEVYIQATHRRHSSQIARNHPERLELNEFLCPLCKALGNTFIPIIWKGKPRLRFEDIYPHCNFQTWITSQVGIQISRFDKSPERPGTDTLASTSRYRADFADYIESRFIAPVASKLSELPQVDVSQFLASQTSQLNSRFTAHIAPYLVQGENRDAGANATESKATNQQLSSYEELLLTYQRLRTTMGLNGLHTAHEYSTVLQPTDFTHVDTIIKCLGYSISAVEIAQRGTGSKTNCTILDGIPTQTLSNLHIISETISSYIAVGGLVNQGHNKSINEYIYGQNQLCRQLFLGHPMMSDREISMDEMEGLDPLLNQDLFNFLAEGAISLTGAPLRINIYHLIQLCYLAEIIKVFTVLAMNLPIIHTYSYPSNPYNVDKAKSGEGCQCNLMDTSTVAKMASFLNHINRLVSSVLPAGTFQAQVVEYNDNILNLVCKLVHANSLTFLRKSILLLNVRFGVEISPVASDKTEEPELVRLCSALRLPSLGNIMTTLHADSPDTRVMHSMVRGWTQHWAIWKQKEIASSGSAPVISLSHPTIFELVGLPRNYDTLTDEAIRRRCPKTGKALTDACLCLFCGEIFCSQAICCMEGRSRGGCNQHLQRYVFYVSRVDIFPNSFSQLLVTNWYILAHPEMHGAIPSRA